MVNGGYQNLSIINKVLIRPYVVLKATLGVSDESRTERVPPTVMPRSRSESISQDVMFDILSNARRRYVLHYLRQTDGPVDLGELSQELAAWENETSVEELTKQQRKRVYVSLYQTHIQKLADAGVVEYDQDSGMVALANGAAEIGQYLSVVDDEERARWQEAYIALAALCGIVYALVAFDVMMFGLVSELQIGSAIVLAFVALAAAHYVLTRREQSEIPTEALIRNR